MVTGGVLRCVFCLRRWGICIERCVNLMFLLVLCVCVYCVRIVYLYVQHEMSRVMVFVSLESVDIWLSYGGMKFEACVFHVRLGACL